MDLCAKRFNMSAQLHEEGHVQGVQGLGPIENIIINMVVSTMLFRGGAADVMRKAKSVFGLASFQDRT